MQSYRSALLGMAFVALPVAVMAAPWFGQPTPEPTNDPTVAVVGGPSDPLPTQPPKFGPGPKSELLNSDILGSNVKTIIDFSLQSKAAGDYLWGRVTGTPAYYDTVSWAVNSMKQGGLSDAHLEDFTTELTTPTAGEVRIVADPSFGDGTKDVVLTSAMVGGKGPVNGSVTAPLIYVGHGGAADLLGRDVKGKIAVFHSNPNPGLYSTDETGVAAGLVKAGAAGTLELLEQVGNLQSYDSDRHGCGTSLCFTIGGEDGFFLENVLGKAGNAGKTVTATLRSTSSDRTGLKAANGVATIPGKTDRTIIINAHADAWFVGGDDNASGLAVEVALARYFAKQPKPEHTLVFVISAGHHTQGRGIPEFRKLHDKDYVARADLVVNLEHVSGLGLVRSVADNSKNNFGRAMNAATTEWPMAVGVSNKSPFLLDAWRHGANCFNLSLQRVIDTENPGELGAYHDIQDKVPLTQAVSATPLYHTTGDGVAAVPADGLERIARFYAYLIRESDKANPELLKGAPYSGNAACPAIP